MCSSTSVAFAVKATIHPAICLIFTIAVQWGQKAIRRKTTGSGRMRYMKTLSRRFKNGFQEGELPVPMHMMSPAQHQASSIQASTSQAASADDQR